MLANSSISSSDFGRFLAIYIGLTGMIVCSMLGLNWAVDPFGIFHAGGQRGWNYFKPEIQAHERLARAYQLALQKPDTVLLGTSRVEVGLRTNHQVWARLGAHCYNSGLSGATIFEIRRYFEYARTVAPLRRAVIGLDLISFDGRQSESEDFDEGRLTARSPLAGEGLAILLSVDVSFASFRTLSAQGVPSYGPDGQRRESLELDYIRRDGGNLAAARKYEARLMTDHHALTFVRPKGGSTLDDFRAIVREAREGGIDLRLFISPTNARDCEAIDIMGLWPKLEAWKQSLVSILAEDAQTHPGERPYSLVDFSGYNPITSEPFPTIERPDTYMRFYHDSSHYRQAVGDMILARLFDEDARTADFGIELSPKSLFRAFVDNRRARTLYRLTHVIDAEDVRATYRKAAAGF